ncbi:MAG: hypothetical protein EXR82_05240 [Gammaproteobacteria bacterium]|nr:hypothetical protein [Gammaproteobacteria bacterium]
MNKLTVTAGVAVLSAAFSSGAQAYSATATVTFAWGGADPANTISWTASGVNTLGAFTNATYFTLNPTGSNSKSYYNADFATASDYDPGTADDCLTPPGPTPGNPPEDLGYDTIQIKRYGCRVSDSSGYNSPLFLASPVLDTGPAASASGTVTITDTTLTGILTIAATGDESSPALGAGATGFNYRSADGSPFGNVWYGVSSTATLTVALTGTFTATDWNITGGTARLVDPSFQCQQGGFGGGPPGFILCNPSTNAGGYQTNGAALSFGWDLDGAGANTTMGEVEVRNGAGDTVLLSLGGVLAAVAVDSSLAISTTTGEYRAGLGSANGPCITSIRWTGTAIGCGTLTVGPLVITGNVVGPPDQFTFVDQTDVPLATVITSNTITLAGTEATYDITVANGEYSVGCTGTFTQTAGTIAPGGTVCVRQTSSATPATATTTTLTIGGVSGGFTVTTVPADTTPDAFTFVDQTNVALSTPTSSAAVTITGINTATPISVTGGEYSIAGAAFTAVAATVTNGQAVTVRQTSSATPATATTTTLTIGGVSGGFTVTTVPADTTPDAFAFLDVTNAELSTPYTSNTVTITGINTATPISVTGGEYSVAGGAFTAAPATVTSGQTVAVRQTSSGYERTATNTVLTVGGVSDTYTVTTAASGSIEIDGGSSSVDGMMLGLLGFLAAMVGRGAARRRKIAGA